MYEDIKTAIIVLGYLFLFVALTGLLAHLTQ